MVNVLLPPLPIVTVAALAPILTVVVAPPIYTGAVTELNNVAVPVVLDASNSAEPPLAAIFIILLVFAEVAVPNVKVLVALDARLILVAEPNAFTVVAIESNKLAVVPLVDMVAVPFD
jgi:hypothetical protein